MRDEHLTAETLDQLLAEDAGLAHNRLLLHHLAVCPACHAVGGYILELYEAGALPPRFCSVDIDLARLRAEAPALLETLERYSPRQRECLVRDVPRFRSWGLCELLCQRSEELGPSDVARALECADLAVAIAEALEDWQPVEHTWLCQLRALAAAQRGNALRVGGHLRRAEQAFGEAGKWWTEGEDAGNALGYEPRILAMKASLRHAQRRLPEALALLEQAQGAEPEEKLRAMILINTARVLEEAGRYDEALAALRDAQVLVEAHPEPRLVLCVRQNTLWLETTLGHYEQARADLPEVGELCARLGGALDMVRLRWAEARIAAGLGEPRKGISLFEEARQAFLSAGVGFDAALVSLELAALYAEMDERERVKVLAQELLPIFQGQGVHREALAALGLFVQAAANEEASAGLSRRILTYLRQARFNPRLRFVAEA